MLSDTADILFSTYFKLDILEREREREREERERGERVLHFSFSVKEKLNYTNY